MADFTYKSIAKANSIFGGVQIINILISIVRSKFVAVILGPSGIGLMGLFQSTLDLIKSATNMGLSTAAVRDISIAYNTNDINKIKITKTIISRLIWLTGLLGTLVTYIGAPYLSEITFSSTNYTIHFRILSIILLINQLTVQHNVILQGMRQLKKLASANIIGSFLGLIINVPLFYFLGEEGIIPALILLALSSYLVAWYNSNKLHIESLNISWKETFITGKSMLKMGFMLGLTGLMDMIIIYIVKVAIQDWGSIAEVGLYTAGFAIVQQYVNLIFGAIGTDYYPRLCAASNDKAVSCEIINKQFEIMILVLTPLILLFISFSPIILYVLYSSKFLSVSMMINWIALGMLLRAYSWCPGFLYLAKGDSKLYFIIYIITFFVNIILYLGAYKLGGLTGLGIAFPVLNFIIIAFGLYIIYKKYDFVYNKTSNLFMLMSLMAGGLLIVSSYLISSPYTYLVNISILIISSIYSYKQLDKRLEIKSFIAKKVQRH